MGVGRARSGLADHELGRGPRAGPMRGRPGPWDSPRLVRGSSVWWRAHDGARGSQDSNSQRARRYSATRDLRSRGSWRA